MGDLYATLGENVARCRRDAGLKQADLAQAIDLSRASIANIETGRQRILLHQAFELARALNVSVNDLVPGFSPKARDIIRISSRRFKSERAA